MGKKESIVQKAKRLGLRIHILQAVTHANRLYGPKTLCSRPIVKPGDVREGRKVYLYLSVKRFARLGLKARGGHICWLCAVKYKNTHGHWIGDTPPDPKRIVGRFPSGSEQGKLPFNPIDPEDLDENLKILKDRPMPLDVLIIDNGWMDGDLGTIVGAAISGLIDEKEKEE